MIHPLSPAGSASKTAIGTTSPSRGRSHNSSSNYNYNYNYKPAEPAGLGVNNEPRNDTSIAG
jgi:hypothetical protein